MAGKYIARHGAMRFLGEFAAPEGARYARGGLVVVPPERGLGPGGILCEATARARGLHPQPHRGQPVRRESEQDQAESARLRQAELREFETCNRFIAARKLQMELVDVEHLFGGERIIFYFLAEKRVDFRELVKDLAREYRTRIEM